MRLLSTRQDISHGDCMEDPRSLFQGQQHVKRRMSQPPGVRHIVFSLVARTNPGQTRTRPPGTGMSCHQETSRGLTYEVRTCASPSREHDNGSSFRSSAGKGFSQSVFYFRKSINRHSTACVASMPSGSLAGVLEGLALRRQRGVRDSWRIRNGTSPAGRKNPDG